MTWRGKPKRGLRGEWSIEPRGLRLRRRQSSPWGRLLALTNRLMGYEPDAPTTRVDRRTWEEV